jgi:glycosyltransferase involved in cell wall biosynthesis/peptidoglycan/xylan/chitin deacetylase (PgdA/CDA1 family)
MNTSLVSKKNCAGHLVSAHPEPKFGPGFSRLSVQARMKQIALKGAATIGVALNGAYGDRADMGFGILMYHRICDPVSRVPEPTINVPGHQFRRQLLGLLQRGFVFWPLRKLIYWHHHQRPIPPYVSAITFDDGFASVYHDAWPVLREFNLPATVFLNTAYLDCSGPMPFDDWGAAYREKVPAKAYSPLAVQQCLEMAETGLVEFGSHTHTHEDFRNRARDLERDLETSLRRLETIFQSSDFTFAFPYGIPKLGYTDPELVNVVKKCGFACALSTDPVVNRPESTPYSWGRYNVFPWDSPATLEAKLKGCYSWAPRLWQRLSPIPRTASLRIDSDKTSKSALKPSNAGIPERIGDAKAQESLCIFEGPRLLSDEKDFISVIVPSFNRAYWLKDAIESLIKQETDDCFEYEIVVIDNCSTDNTAKVVNRYTDKSKMSVRYLYQTVKGDGPTRNHGINHSQGNWIAFFDDDQLAEPRWLYELWRAAKTLDASIVGGRVVLDLPARKKTALGKSCREMLREINYHPDFHPYTSHRLPGTCNALVSREVFNRLGTFKEDMREGGSDHELFIRARRAGFSLWYTPHAIIHHRFKDNRLTDRYFRWEALSGGIVQAKYVDHKGKGASGLVLLCAARMIQTLLLHVPTLSFHSLRNQKRETLDRKVRIWRTEGYVRATLAIFFPKRFGQGSFFDGFEFRKGRSIGLSNAK